MQVSPVVVVVVVVVEECEVDLVSCPRDALS
jgi:hypothetical protein